MLKKGACMLSAAQHLHYFLGNKPMRILCEVYPERCERAEDDMIGAFFSILLAQTVI
jgi:hypothetical protein